MTNKIIDYLNQTYKPHGIIIYGSFINNTNTDTSDFDVLVISDSANTCTDNNIIHGIPLDAFIYNTNDILNTTDFSKFIQIHDGKIVMDEKNIAYKLIIDVNDYINSTRIKSENEKQHLIKWLNKMLNRAFVKDCEGNFRAHWLLTDSLEIYFNLRDLYYFGPKKSLMYMKENFHNHFIIYEDALKYFTYENTKKWINCVLDNK